MGDINIDTFKDSMDYDFSAIIKSILFDNKEKMTKDFDIVNREVPIEQIEFWPNNPRLLEFTRTNTELQPVDIKNYFFKKEGRIQD